MARKAIAVVLLLVIAAWAEMTLAPLLAMHAGHMSPGHEMAADMPMHHAGHHHASPAPAKRNGLPCCPSVHRTAPPAEVLVLVSGSPACDDPHSCCFRQGPQSVPAPVRNVEKATRSMAPAVIIEVSPALGTARPTFRDSALALSPPPDVFGMTLRI